MVYPTTDGSKVGHVSSSFEELQVSIILLDIEGTTTPLEFVYETLFPYARDMLESFLCKHFREPEIESIVQQLHMQQKAEEGQGLQPPNWAIENISSNSPLSAVSREFLNGTFSILSILE
jgi:hypothetical protein